jgi:hypothetical protein
MKSLFALSWMLFHEKWKVFSDASTAFRFPGMMMAGVAMGVVYRFGARLYSRRAGVMASLLFGLMPQLFYHAHLACFDMGIAAMWVLCVYTYWRAGDGGIGRALLAGVVFGLTLETKHNAWILPAVFVPHALIVEGRALLRGMRQGRVVLPLRLVALGTVGPLVFYALWPWIWHDTVPRLQEYVNFHLHHEYYNMEFLGTNYFGPPSPRAYLPVLVVATVPTVTLVLFAIGGVDRLIARGRGLSGQRADGQATDLLMALAFFACLGPWVLPTTPIFGGTKHWLTAYPILALFAGRGFDLVVEGAVAAATCKWKWSKGGRVMMEVGLALSVLAGPLAETAHAHPFGLGAYVPLVGGTAGGADLGLNRQFWGYTTQDANGWLEGHAPRGAALFIHDTAWDSWGRLQAEGRVRSDLRGVGSPSEAQVAIVHHELHMNEVDYSIWVDFGTVAPAFVVTHDGVPMVSIYRRP